MVKRTRQWRWAATLGVAALAASAAPVLAQQPVATGISLTPAKIEVDQSGRDVAQTLTLTNNDPSPHTIRLALTGLGHDLDGNPQYEGGPPAGSNLHADAGQLTLVPHVPAKVNVTGTIPPGGPGLYAGVVMTVDEGASPSNVNVVNRLAAPILIRGPRPWRETSEVGQVTVANTAQPHQARIEAVIKDTGDVHIRPTGTADVVRNGVKIATVPLHGDTILPGLARRLGVSWDVPADVTKGPLTVKVHILKPVPAESEAVVDFDPAGSAPAVAVTTETTAAGPSAFGAAAPHRKARHHGWALLLALLLLLAALLLLLWLWRKKRRRDRERERAAEAAGESLDTPRPAREPAGRSGR